MMHNVTWWGRVVDAYSHAWDSRVPGFGVVVVPDARAFGCQPESGVIPAWMWVACGSCTADGLVL